MSSNAQLIGSIDLDLVCPQNHHRVGFFPTPKVESRRNSFEDSPKFSSRRLSERESELVVADEVPLPGLKGPSDYEARAFG